jgi:CheY-like chemotaxis protein
MSPPTRSTRNILIASDNSTDAALVLSLLKGTFDHVSTSTDEAKAAADFERLRPRVLVLAFNALAKAQRYCLAVYRLGIGINAKPHRTIILCDKEELREVSELCLKHSFDDYVLFWPLNHDAPRLRMSVQHALRELALLEDAGPAAADFATQARRLAELEALLELQLASAGQRVGLTSHAIEQAEHHIGSALDGFSRRMSEGALPGVVQVRDAAGLNREMDRIKRDEIHPPLQAAADSIEPMKQWVDDFKQEFAPYVASARTLGAMAQQVAATLLIVDDDDLQQVLAGKILAGPNRRLVFASSGAEALQLASKLRPDLILMDLQMPGMDGIETTRRLKAAPQLAGIPVIMLTGKSDGTAVVDSMKAGAADYVLKPYDREKLTSKVARWLGQKAPGAAA